MNSTNNLCDSIWPLHIPKEYKHTIIITTLVLSPTMFALNIFLIVVINKVNHVKSTTDKLIICMSLSDACSGGIVLPLVAIMLKSDNVSCGFQLTVQFLAFLMGYASFFFLTAIAMDRYLHLIKLSRYNEFMNKFRLRLIIFAIFAVSSLLALITVFHYSFYLQAALNVMNVLTIIGIFAMYCSVLRSLLLHAKSLARRKVAMGDMAINRPAHLKPTQSDDTSFVNPQSLRAQESKEEQGPNKIQNNKIAPINSLEPNEEEIVTTNAQIISYAPSDKPKKQRNSTKKSLISNKRDVTVTRTILILLTSVFLLYMPYNVLTPIWTYHRFFEDEHTGFLVDVSTIWSYIVLFCNGIFNVLILGSSNSKIKKYVVEKIRKP